MTALPLLACPLTEVPACTDDRLLSKMLPINCCRSHCGQPSNINCHHTLRNT